MPFRFKQFSISDDVSSMKVGTDAVLLGARAGNIDPRTILDIGSGSGLVALMLAQRYPEARITAIDVHGPSARQAHQNFLNSPWAERLESRHISLQQLAGGQDSKYDLIVTNPPFFAASLLPSDENKKLARHDIGLSHAELAVAVSSLLSERGQFSLIIPALSHTKISTLLQMEGLHERRQLKIYPVTGKPANRLISEWTRQPGSLIVDKLSVRDNRQRYTDDYLKLTMDFYLAL
jgi:tRNA1Val (adenine37-N6)-methyltransferase